MEDLTRLEVLFLQKIWAPIALHGERLWKPRTSVYHALNIRPLMCFIFNPSGAKLFIELIEHNNPLDDKEQSSYNQLYNELTITGWRVLRFSEWHVQHEPATCQKMLRQALDLVQEPGPQVNTHGGYPEAPQEARKQQISEFIMCRSGIIRAQEVAAEFNLSIRSAADSLMLIAKEERLPYICGPKPTQMMILNKWGWQDAPEESDSDKGGMRDNIYDINSLQRG
ncbi:hypothetical protein [Paenibacillus aestuarii]|uniref:DUF559 domain-containing protein n=1 Tax=Paenibacillus aestuarii TaxID=516965 RepID=A0ABW0K1B6_9BACL|nr:hypothetical protein [Paenibacillus aestuarii]